MRIKYLVFFILFASCNSIVYSQVDSNKVVSSQKLDSISKKKTVLDYFVFKKGNALFSTFPAFGYDPGSGFLFGLIQNISIEKQDTSSQFNRKTTFVNFINYSTNNWANAKSEMQIYTKKGYKISGFVDYLKAPDKFYGIGQDTAVDNPALYLLQRAQLKGSISKPLSDIYYIGLSFDATYTDIAPDNMPGNSIQVPTDTSKVLLGFGPYFSIDTRNDINYPSKGNFLAIEIIAFPKITANNKVFSKYSLDYRKYFSLSNSLILATQAFIGISNGDMPFYEMFQLGGKSRLRGISNKYKFIDKNSLYSQIELRQLLNQSIALVVFTGIGNVYNKFKELEDSPIKYVYGGGLRIKASKTDRINLRFDYARSIYNDKGFYVTMSEAF